MSVMKADSKAKTPKEYIDSVPDARRADIIKMDKLIRQTVPGLKPFICYGMLGYGPFHYKYASGREGDWCVLALANQKNYMSFYVCAAEDGRYIAEANRHRLPKASIGKSCIRYKKLDDLDLDVIKELCVKAEAAAKHGNFAA